ncbi:MAG: hypothetical protein WA667_19780 [Candidatus Nitrosopolaris sp.]
MGSHFLSCQLVENRDAVSIIPHSKLENTSIIVEKAKGPIANPKSFPNSKSSPGARFKYRYK